MTDLPDERVPELRRLADEGVTSYKLFMAYPGVLLTDDATIFRALRKAGEYGTLVCMHAENGIVIDELVDIALAARHIEPKYHALTRPARLEGEGGHRALAIAEVARAPVYIVHLSCHDALTEPRRAQERGVMAHAETCLQYLLLDVSAYDEPGFDGAKYVTTSPQREKWNQDELWRGLRGRDIDVISSDHCPFNLREQKEIGRGDFSRVPNGGPGVENRMSLIYHHGVNAGRIDLNRFVELTSTAAARIFGMFPRKGTIAVGSDADIVIFDPEREVTISRDDPRTHHMNVDYSVYEGFHVRGYPETVLSRGRVMVDDGVYIGRPGDGRFIRRRPYGGAYVRRIFDVARLRHRQLLAHYLIREPAAVYHAEGDGVGGVPVALEEEVRIAQEFGVACFDASLPPRCGVVETQRLFLRDGAAAQEVEQGPALVGETLPAPRRRARPRRVAGRRGRARRAADPRSAPTRRRAGLFRCAAG